MYLSKKYTYGAMLSNKTGTVMAKEAPHRNRVTGGTRRISVQRDISGAGAVGARSQWKERGGGTGTGEGRGTGSVRLRDVVSAKVDEVTCGVSIAFPRNSRTFEFHTRILQGSLLLVQRSYDASHHQLSEILHIRPELRTFQVCIVSEIAGYSWQY